MHGKNIGTISDKYLFFRQDRINAYIKIHGAYAGTKNNRIPHI